MNNETLSLRLTFQNGEGKTQVLSISNPKKGLEAAAVKAAMQKIVDAKAFQTKAGDEKFVKVVSAKYYTTNSNVMFDDSNADAADKPAA